MKRTEEQAAADLAEAMEALGLGLRLTNGGSPGSLEAVLPGGAVHRFHVVALASPAAADVERLVRTRRRSGHNPVLVADRVVPRAREQLARAGWNWFDRRGHLRIKADALLVDAAVPPLHDGRRARARPVLESVVGLAAAAATLTSPGRRMSVRALVLYTGHSLGAVHEVLRALKEEKLLDGNGLPVVPDLFWEASVHWRPRRVPLRERPPAPVEGWALCDSLAAARWGAPVVVRGDHPPDLYVPDERAVRVCRQQHGDALSEDTRQATVAVPPVRWALAHSASLGGEAWRVVHPVVAALDLSVDLGRGREILDQWEPPDPYRRVW